MPNDTDIRVTEVALYLLPVTMRVPLRFGAETVTSVTCARVRVEVASPSGGCSAGWGETPLSAAWAWPAAISCESRIAAMCAFCLRCADAWRGMGAAGHPMTLGYAFLEEVLPAILREVNLARAAEGLPEMPRLAALVCASAFDIALHDAYGKLYGISAFDALGPAFLERDLSWFFGAESPAPRGLFPDSLLARPAPRTLIAWHLVGGADALVPGDLSGDEPADGYPVTLVDWIRRDGLRCLKIKLKGVDADWDRARIVAVGRLALAEGVECLSVDFNCTVKEPAYVNDILDAVARDEPALYSEILYVEQPFPYDLERRLIDVRTVSARKPLFMDESAHDWRSLRLGAGLGWSGVALKTCKTFTGAILSLSWAKLAGMAVMVQDLTNPMLAHIAHVQLAAHAGTIMGVEANSMQYYPEASLAEAKVHPGLYSRVDGRIRLDSLGPAGFGYRVDEIGRKLPDPVFQR